MNRLLTFSIACLGLILTAHSGRAQTYRFGLQAEKMAVPAGPWQVARVLDLRADRSRLGAVHRGVENQVASADFAQPLAGELLQFIRAQLPPQPSARPVVMRVFELAIGEDLRATAEYAEAELVADFLEPQPDSTYRLLLTVGETVRHSGLDATKHHPANLAQALQQSLRQLMALPVAPATSAEFLSRTDALGGRGGAATQRFAIQAAAAPKRGLYRSLQEFRNNTPSEPEFPFAIQHIAHTGKRWAGSDEVLANYLGTDDNHPTRPIGAGSVWGLSDGTEVLMAYRNRFYKLLPAADGRSYTFVGPPVYDPEVAAGRAAAAIAGGLIGAALASAATGPDLMVPYELHLASGRVLPVQSAGQTDADGFARAPDTARVYVYRRPDANKDQVAAISVGGQPAASLRPRQWTAVLWSDRRRELNLCAQAGTGALTCREFVPDFSQPTYLECVVPAGGGPPELRPVSAKEGLFELRRIQRLAKAAQ